MNKDRSEALPCNKKNVLKRMLYTKVAKFFLRCSEKIFSQVIFLFAALYQGSSFLQMSRLEKIYRFHCENCQPCKTCIFSFWAWKFTVHSSTDSHHCISKPLYLQLGCTAAILKWDCTPTFKVVKLICLRRIHSVLYTVCSKEFKQRPWRWEHIAFSEISSCF